jgi:hypothetical protein
MMSLRRASVIVALSLLTSAATASAECAWVLWTRWSTDERFASVDGYETKRECERALAMMRGMDKATGTKDPSQLSLCLPDTVDPRGPKGK